MLKRLKVSNAALTALKLIGITAMLVDHYNSLVKPEYSPLLYEIGRLALPLFAFVLGYNLARIPVEKMPKIMLRLLLFGVIATPIYNILGAGLWHWWPLNILFTLFFRHRHHLSVVSTAAQPCADTGALSCCCAVCRGGQYGRLLVDRAGTGAGHLALILSCIST